MIEASSTTDTGAEWFRALTEGSRDIVLDRDDACPHGRSYQFTRPASANDIAKLLSAQHRVATEKSGSMSLDDAAELRTVSEGATRSSM